MPVVSSTSIFLTTSSILKGGGGGEGFLEASIFGAGLGLGESSVSGLSREIWESESKDGRHPRRFRWFFKSYGSSQSQKEVQREPTGRSHLVWSLEQILAPSLQPTHYPFADIFFHRQVLLLHPDSPLQHLLPWANNLWLPFIPQHLLPLQ